MGDNAPAAPALQRQQAPTLLVSPPAARGRYLPTGATGTVDPDAVLQPDQLGSEQVGIVGAPPLAGECIDSVLGQEHVDELT